ncbi:hypothetical protein LJK88_15120 [Paenibacillus sp. P26]|nr:hypothetical protein LJK88_15120 [Paenibacillus sp. P26]UUZ97394.1 hypothetical protein LJK87_22610 [Paenibacillus sp. P25]
MEAVRDERRRRGILAGDPGRKHTRIQYYRSEGNWKHRRLWP